MNDKILKKLKESLVENRYLDSMSDHTRNQIHQLRSTKDEDHINSAAKSSNKEVAINAAFHPHATEKTLHTALNHPSHEVRKEVFSNLNANNEHIKKGLKDPHADVSFAAFAAGAHDPKVRNYAREHGHPQLKQALSNI